MTRSEWDEIEASLGEAAGLDDASLQEWLNDAPEKIRKYGRLLFDSPPIFGAWAAEAASSVVSSVPRLSVPCTLTHYQVLRRVGAGGMGEVYEAEDPRLKRKVAIKVLHSGAARRLDEEAQALARLRHPNICRIYDVGRVEGIEYFVMELLDGVPLSSRLGKGPLPLVEALSIGTALARALAEAHRLGIVHRDVKPANVLLTRNGPSLVDFGIADNAAGDGGVPAGTPPYMAPEQARGVSDPRSDVYSVGAVLREMTPQDAPAPVRKVIDLCLRDDPEERWQSAADLACALEWLLEPIQTEAPAPWWRRWWLGYLAAGALALGALAWIGTRSEQQQAQVMVPLVAPRNYTTSNEWEIAVSPDATRVAFIAPGQAGERLVWIRKLSGMNADPIPASVGATLVFWSPDGESIGFFKQGEVQTIHVATGAFHSLGQVPGPALRGIWGEDGHILYSTNNMFRDGVIYRIPVAGGAAQRVTALNDAEEEFRQGYQVLLPGNDHFLFVAGSNLMVATVDEPGHTFLANFKRPGWRKLMLRGAFPAGAAGNRVFYVRENKLWSRRFDVRNEDWSSEPRLEIESVSWAKVTPTGVVLYMPAPPKSRPVWVDRRGRRLAEVPVPEGDTIGVGVSRGGTALVTRYEEQSAVIGLWVVRDGVAERIGSGPGRYIGPAWSADGKWIYFAGYDGSGLNRRPPVPGAQEELLIPRDGEDRIIRSTTQDGRFGFGTGLDVRSGRGFDVFRFDFQTRKRQDWRASKASESQPAVSPDGRWVAWLLGGKLCLSPIDDPRQMTALAERGSEPQWSRDGRQLYFASGGWLHSIAVSFPGGKPAAGAPERLFPLCDIHRFGARYAVCTDNRFLMREPPRAPQMPILVWNPQRSAE